MEERIPMNTKSLQKHFKTEYESFFAKNDLVVSGTHCFPWVTSGFKENKDKIHIKQKIPTKTLCGINIINEHTIELGTLISFDVITKKFIEKKFTDTMKPGQEEQLKKFLLSFLDTNGFTKGLILNFFSENPRGHGLGFSGTCGALLANGLHLLTKKTSLNEYKNYDNFVQSDLFQEIFALGMDIEKIFKYDNSIGNNCYSSMINTQFPTVTFAETLIHDQPMKIHNYKIKDFFGITNTIEDINLDYGVIFSGIHNKVEHIQHVSSNTKQDIEELQNNALGILHHQGIKDIKKFPFKDVFLSGFNQVLKDMGFVHNFKTLNYFKQIIEKGFDTSVVDSFIQVLKENSYMSLVLEGEHKMINLFKYCFDSLKILDEEVCVVFPINTLKTGGSFVFVCKHNKSRQTLDKTIKKMQELGYQDTTLEYASWIDGTSHDGIIIEQWINGGMFSNYVQKDQVYYKNNQGESFLGNYNELLAQEKNGLLLDMIHNKMYLNGKKLTSTDLCSQTTTINILSKLMENIGQDVRNKEFEISSYSKNKNEMLGKIILPLISLIEKETGEAFPLICKGSIYDFYIKLNPSIIKISVVKKM